MRRRHAWSRTLTGLILIVATARPGLAGIADTPLPTFADAKASVLVVSYPGVVKRGRLETEFFCASSDTVPIDIGVEVFDSAGGLLNSITTGVGAVLNVASGQTVTLATSTTATYLESAVIPLADGLQGSARVVASSANVSCTAAIVDDALAPPVSLVALTPGVHPTAGPVLASITLPQFADAQFATHAAVFPGVVKRGAMETNVFCTSLASQPFDLGVEIFAPNGIRQNDVALGNGALLGVTPGRTVAFGTTGSAAFLETAVISLVGVAQGVARVVSTSPLVTCSALVLDATLTPPAAMSGLTGWVLTSAAATPTGTASATVTRTGSATPTRTASRTPTASATRTATPSASVTRSTTATPSRTSTASATSTATATRTRTASPSATPSLTATRMMTPLPTVTRTAAMTASATTTRTATHTRTRTSTVTPPAPPTATLAASATASVSATRTATTTATATRTPSRTHTASSTPAQTTLASATPSASASSSASPTSSVAVPTATADRVTETPTFTAALTTTPTVTTPVTNESATPTPPLAAVTTTSTPVLTDTPTRPPALTPTAPPVPSCVGDCGGNLVVTVDELVRGVNIALDHAPVEQCPAFDANQNQRVTIDELVAAVGAALAGCADRHA